MVHVRNLMRKFFAHLKTQDKLTSISIDETDYFSSLCDDIMIEILCNLDMESILACKVACQQWHSLISSSRFVEHHLKRAKPITIVCFKLYNPLSHRRIKTSLFLLDDLGKTSKLVKVHGLSQFYSESNGMILHGSCNGILLLRMTDSRISLLYNPTRNEIVKLSLIPPGRILGFFFDKLNKEYKILQCCLEHEQAHYFTYGLTSKHKKQLETFGCYPSPNSNISVTLSMSICWIVYRLVRSHKYSYHVEHFPIHSENIMVYELDTERLHVISGPRLSNQDSTDWNRVELLGWGSKLVFLEPRGKLSRRVDIWVLEDFENGCWVKRQVIHLNEDFKHFKFLWAAHKTLFVKLLNITNGELLVMWPDGLFWYNIASKRVRIIEMEPDFHKSDVFESRALTHVTSLVSTNAM